MFLQDVSCMPISTVTKCEIFLEFCHHFPRAKKMWFSYLWITLKHPLGSDAHAALSDHYQRTLTTGPPKWDNWRGTNQTGPRPVCNGLRAWTAQFYKSVYARYGTCTGTVLNWPYRQPWDMGQDLPGRNCMSAAVFTAGTTYIYFFKIGVVRWGVGHRTSSVVDLLQ